MRAGKAVQDSCHSATPSLADHRTCIVFGISGMNHYRTLELAREQKLRGECAALLDAWRVVVVIIESAFTNGDSTAGDKLAQHLHVTHLVETGGIVRVDPHGVEDVAWMMDGESHSSPGGGEDILFTASGSDTDYRAGPGGAGPFDYLVAVAVERRVGEVRVAVDEVWNAAILRGHLRSIQRRTGLAT